MWSVAFRLLLTGSAISLALAPPAAADTGGYLHALQDVYTSLSTQQLLSEGTRVCDSLRSGANSTQTVQMVQRDLGVSIPASGDIVSAAVVNLGC
jgi:cobalamin biosynthesis protein CobD/CbiB